MNRTSRLPHWPPRFPGVGKQNWQFIARLSLALATAVILTTLLYFHLDYYLVESRLERFRVDQPIPRDVRAPREILWDDIAETKRLQDEAANSVLFTYISDPSALTKAQGRLNLLFDSLTSSSPTEVDREIPQDVVQIAYNIDGDTLRQLRVTARDILSTVMEGNITPGEAQQQAGRQLEILARQRLPDADAATVVGTLTRLALRPTRMLDEARTRQAQRQARESISLVIRRFASGDTILRKGDILTRNDLRQLREHRVLLPLTPLRMLPLAVLLLFAILGMGTYLHRFGSDVYENQRKLLLLACLVIVSVWMAITLRGQHEYLVGLLVIPAASMIVAGMVGAPAAVLTTLLISTLLGLTSDLQLFIVMLTVASSLAGILVVSAIWPASRVLPALGFLSGINLLLLLCIEALRPGGGFTSFWPNVGTMTLWAATSGFGAGIIAVGAIYAFARLFGITTHYRLMELSNPNQPLLRRMIQEAPGTYHSSVMVANIAQAAADAIGADALFTRVAALYHDIGKLKRPAFFVENQAPLGIDNAHQRLSPKLSYLILANHVRDGVEVGRQYKLPDEIVSVIREHHGTTLAAYFYHRALNEGNSEQVVEHDFRYPGPKPTTREAAVVMLADSVQASVKSLKEPTPNRIEAMVQEIVNNRLDDGQLDDCNLTFRDLRMISEVLVRILSGLYTYTRLEYPDIQGTRHRANLHLEKSSASSESPPAAQSN
ncbi:MAG: HD family phosphohydrolase [Armatimonadota bacterium]